MLDHLVYAAPDVAGAADALAAALGVRPATGGRHPALGTHNALLSLGTGRYLEVIGPDPDAPAPGRPRPFGIDDLDAPRLVTWAMAVTGIEDRVAACRQRGYDPGPVTALQRRAPDGATLSWRLTMPTGAGGGLVPFLIEWDAGIRHPSLTAPGGVMLAGLRATHPDPASVETALAAVGAELEVAPGTAPRLTAELRGPGGAVTLR